MALTRAIALGGEVPVAPPPEPEQHDEALPQFTLDDHGTVYASTGPVPVYYLSTGGLGYD